MNVLKSIFQAGDFMALAGTKSYRQACSGEKRGKKKVKICFSDPRIVSLNFVGVFFSCRRADGEEKPAPTCLPP